MDNLCGLTISVDCDDLLAITLQRNMRHFRRCVVVTSYEDERTAQVVRAVEGAELLQTNTFQRDGAPFFVNKAWALEEGFDFLGRLGWILLWDADIVLPETFATGSLDPDVIYGAKRRQLPAGVVDIDGDWTDWGITGETQCAGFFQLFNASAAGLQSRPWYPRDINDAWESDRRFVQKFKATEWLPECVLHIDAKGENWFGRATPRLDGTPVEGAEKRRVQMGELLLSLKWPWWRPDLQQLALAARRAASKES